MGWVWHALLIAGSMTWQLLWALVLGFALAATVQAIARRQTVTALLGDDSARSLTVASGLGMASSSCSYASVALARSLFRKGASFTAAMVFEIASTNLVLELGILLALFVGWQFTLAEFVGGPVMIVGLAVLFRLFLRRRLVADALTQANRGVAGSMEGHAAMDLAVTDSGPIWKRLTSSRGVTAVSHIFVMEWVAIWRDIAIGLLIAGGLAAWVPDSFWSTFFLTDHPLLPTLWGPIIGPVVAVLSFVCSVGNVPLAAVLWNGGISFGGVVSFLFADLIILPILNIYRKYYGWRMAAFIAATFYLTMVVAGYAVQVLFTVARRVPDHRNATALDPHISWNYTTWLNLIFLALAALLVIRFTRTGGSAMLRHMHDAPEPATQSTT